MTKEEIIIDLEDYLTELLVYARERGKRKLIHLDRSTEETETINATIWAIKEEIDKILNINNK